MGRRIRVWKKDACYHVTLQCIDRMFLLRPSPKVNAIIGASLGRALRKHPVDLHCATTNSNHMEFAFSLSEGQIENASPFLRFFSSVAAKELNCLYQREGHFWSGRARVEEIVSDIKAEKLMGYSACNPVKDGLVEKASHWTGFSTTEALSSGAALPFKFVNRTLERKLTANGRKKINPAAYTETGEITLTPLPGWRALTPEERLTRFRCIVSDHEAMAYRERLAQGIQTVKGMTRVEEESPFSKPSTPRQKSPQPLCHAETKAQYEFYKARYEEIVAAHRVASIAYRAGNWTVEFPPGTFRPPLMIPMALAA